MHVFEGAKKNAEKYGQGHVFNFWQELSEAEQKELLRCTEEFDFPFLNEIFQHKALNAIKQGKVAVLLLAGGQGTRLGVPYPKGMYIPNLPSGRSLYQLQAERLLRVAHCCQESSGSLPSIPWYIMTSDHTKQTSIDYFRSNNYFGYNPEDIVFFEQYNLPAFSFDGSLLLETKSKIACAPDGNGGLYRALKNRGILQDMANRGVEFIQIYCVDNILVKLPDLHFIGFCINQLADCAAETVEKVDPSESIGVLGLVDGRYRVVEYSEISAETAALRLDSNLTQNHSTTVANQGDRNSDLTNRLVYSHGNICIHFVTRAFLERVCQPDVQNQMEYHRARKKVSHIDLGSGDQVVPVKPNAIKMEKFVFDVFPLAERFAIWEVPRNEYFSPLKNGPDATKDCPQTARADLLAYHRKLAEEAGARFGSSNSSSNGCQNNSGPEAVLEISPLVTYSGENLSCLKGQEIRGTCVLELDPQTGKPVLITLNEKSSYNKPKTILQ